MSTIMRRRLVAGRGGISSRSHTSSSGNGKSRPPVIRLASTRWQVVDFVKDVDEGRLTDTVGQIGHEMQERPRERKLVESSSALTSWRRPAPRAWTPSGASWSAVSVVTRAAKNLTLMRVYRGTDSSLALTSGTPPLRACACKPGGAVRLRKAIETSQAAWRNAAAQWLTYGKAQKYITVTPAETPWTRRSAAAVMATPTSTS
jgi:hypothetical protein